MKEWFLLLWEMSFSASVLTAVVMILRLVLKKAPKNMTIWLWTPVLIRLICPFSPESAFSLMPRSEVVPVYGGSVAEQISVTAGVPEGLPTIQTASSPDILSVVSVVWLVGVIGMLVYTLVTYGVLKHRMKESIPLEGRVWLSDRAATPYILGIFSPKIYLPSSMASRDRNCVLAHEQAHLQRGDHIVKPLAFLLLSVYWFNPVMWVAYILLCRDIEMACDERVIRGYDTTEKIKAYSDVLMRCSVSTRSLAACPVAFGETAVASRIRAVLRYKKPKFWIMLTTVLVAAAVSLCFLTDPQNSDAASHKPPDEPPVIVTQSTALPSPTTAAITLRQTETPSTTTLNTTQKTTTTAVTTTTAPTTVPATAAPTVPTAVYTEPPTTAATTTPPSQQVVMSSFDFTLPELVKPPTLPSSYEYNPKTESTKSGISVYGEDIVPKASHPNIPVPRPGYN